MNNRRKRYLLFYFMDHGIWADTNKWRECITSNIKYKMTQSDLRLKWREDRQKKIAEETKEEDTQPKKSKFSSFKSGFGKLKGKVGVMMKSQDQKFKEEILRHQNLIFNELCKAVLHICNMQLPF